MIKILFVCHGNICRSTMAEFYMKEIVRRAGLSGEIEVASAATTNDEAGNDTYYATKDVLTEKGIPFTPRRAVKMTKDDYNTYDYIIVFDEENIRGVERITGLHDAEKVYTLLTLPVKTETLPTRGIREIFNRPTGMWKRDATSYYTAFWKPIPIWQIKLREIKGDLG